jgi:hypothetical protein
MMRMETILKFLPIDAFMFFMSFNISVREAAATGWTVGGGSGGRWKTAPGDGPNGPVRPNGPAWQLGWLSIFGPKTRI